MVSFWRQSLAFPAAQWSGFNKRTLFSACAAVGAATLSGEVTASDSREPGVPPSHLLAECCDANGTVALALLLEGERSGPVCWVQYKVGFGWRRHSKLLQPSTTQRGEESPLTHRGGTSSSAGGQLWGQSVSHWKNFRQHQMSIMVENSFFGCFFRN